MELEAPNGPETTKQLLCSVLIESGVVVRQKHIIECVYRGGPGILNILLASWPQGKIRLNRDMLRLSTLWRVGNYDEKENHTYSGDYVGILWEICRFSGNHKSELMLDFLLERGESLNEICGPSGTALHACIIGVNLNLDSPHPWIRMAERLLARGADTNISGPRGTPL